MTVAPPSFASQAREALSAAGDEHELRASGSRLRRRAVASPIPLEAPVTSAM